MRRSFQIVLCLVLIVAVCAMVSLSGPTAQSSPPTNQRAVTRVSSAAPALQAPATPYLLYFPLIACSSPDLTIAGVRVIQGTSASYSYATYIADRPTTVRVLVSVDAGTSVPGATGRMYAYDGSSNLLGSLDSTNTITAPSDESSMARTLNFNLPSNWLKPNYTYYVDVNPDGAICENRSNDRYPATGRAAFNFVTARPLNVVIVPVFYLPWGASTQFVPAGYDIDNPEASDFGYLTSLPAKVFPVPNVAYTIHSPQSYIPSSSLDDLNGVNGWYKLLDGITAIHNSEDPQPYDTVYYGVVNYYDAHGCPLPGCTIGVGWIGTGPGWGATSVGWTGYPNGAPDATNTMTHEMGHNFGREHTPCSGEGDPDLEYPYSGGSIGVWGLDVATGTLYDPAIYKDYMSYCEPVWTSDYTFAGIKSFRDSVGFDQVRLDQPPVSALYVSGTIAPDGSLTLRPVYQQLARVNVPSKGTHTLELLGDGGKVLAAFPFTPQQIADSKGASGFGFFVPAVDGLAGLRVKAGNRTIKEKSVAAPMAAANFAREPLAAQRQARGTILRWTPAAHPSELVVYRVRLSRDAGATWQVLALDWGSPEFTVPAGVDVANGMIEVQASDGIHTTTRTFNVGATP